MPNQMMSSLTGAKARAKILAGVRAVYDVLKLTLGPEGKNALLPRTYNRGPRITNDGITIAEHVRLLKDEHQRLAAEAFYEGSKKTNELAGDGTTATAVIGGFLIISIFRDLTDQDIPSVEIAGVQSKNISVRALRKEMKDAKDLVIAEIKKKAKPIKTLEDLEKIATISIGREDETSAKTVAKIVWDVARDASGAYLDNHIDVTEGYKGEIETEVIKGMAFPSKVAHRLFVTNPERYEMVANDVPVFITNYKLDNPVETARILTVLKAPKLAIFAPEFSNSVLTMLLKQSEKGLMFYPIKCPALRTVQLEDLAAYTGATVIDKDSGKKLENAGVLDLGFAEKIIVKDTENREDAILLGGKGAQKKHKGENTAVEERTETLKKQLTEARNELDKKQLNKRIANLSSAVGIIRVGASTSSELLYLKLKIEDGVYACKAALQEGYVPGGGVCLKKIAESLPKSALTDALKEPYEQIQRNAGGNLEIGKDVIDPAKVIRLQVEHAVSVASSIITTDISIAEIREKNPAEGYETIAKAIHLYTTLWGKERGLIKESEDASQADLERRSLELSELDNG